MRFVYKSSSGLEHWLRDRGFRLGVGVRGLGVEL